MAEEELVACRPLQRVKQQISVPYLWEEKPGKAKKEWISTPPDAMVSSPSPSRLVVSVPFEWEEKPGKPLQPPEVLPETPPPCLSPPPDHFRQFACYQNPFVDDEMRLSNPFLDEKEESVFAKDQCFLNLTVSHENLIEDCFSATEADGHSSWSSSAMDDVSMDTSVMEFLFPLSSSDTGSADKVFEQERAPTPPAANSHSKLANSCGRCKESIAARRMLTLGELIAFSRKLSYQLKQDDIRRSSYTMALENIRKSMFTCLPFMPRSNKNVS